MSHGSIAASTSHVWAEGKHLFVTWHLYGSLPQRALPAANQANAGPAFVWMDRCRLSPCWTALLAPEASDNARTLVCGEHALWRMHAATGAYAGAPGCLRAVC